MISEGYKFALSAEHARQSNWGASVIKYARGDIMSLAERPYIKTVLDFGCGQGELKTFLRELYPHIEVTEYDPGIPGKDKYPSGQFDLVFSCDVLEHVETEAVDDTIARLADSTRYVLYNNIACYPTRNTFAEGPYQGQDLHLTIRTPDEWRRTFYDALAFDEKMVEQEFRSACKRSQGRVRDRCTILYERVG